MKSMSNLAIKCGAIIRFFFPKRKQNLEKIIGDYLFSTLAKFSEKLTFLTPCYAHVSEDFANVLNEPLKH